MRSSASRTGRESWSASEYAITVLTPSSRHARITRSAISPRLAIITFLNMYFSCLDSHIVFQVQVELAQTHRKTPRPRTQSGHLATVYHPVYHAPSARRRDVPWACADRESKSA